MNIFEEINQKSDIYQRELEAERNKGFSDAEYELDEPAGFGAASSFIFGDAPPKGKTSEYLSAALGWVYACVSAIADGVAGTEFELYTINKKGEIQTVLDHPILDLLYRVNKYTTKFDHFWLTQQYLELAGEAPWYIDRGESGKGEPQNILLLRPDKLDIKKGEDLENPSPIEKYVYRSGPTKVTDISIDEMVFIKYPDPINTFRGKGTLQAAAQTVDIDQYSEEFNKRFFFNSARPDSVLTTDQKLTPRQREALRADIKRIYQGRENAHKTAILEAGLEWKPMTMSQKDMDFLEQQKFTMMKILAIFRTPKPIVAVSDDVNLANAQVAEYVFAKWNISPKLARITAQLNEFLLPMFSGTENMFLDYSDPVPSNIDTDLKRFDSGIGKGYLTINEVREELNLQDIGEMGDKLYLPAGMTPIELAGQQQAAPSQYEFTGGRKKGKLNVKDVIRRSGGGYFLALKRINTKKKQVAQKEAATKKIDDAVNKITEIATGMIEKIIVAKNKKIKSQNGEVAKVVRPEKVTKHVDSYLKTAEKFEPTFQETIKAQFERQKKEVVDKLPAKEVNIDDFVLDPEDESKVVAEVTTPIMRKIIKEQGDLAAIFVGADDFDELTARAQNYIKKRTLKIGFEMTEETNVLLKESLKEGIKLGESIAQIRTRIVNLFDGMEKYRAERIARSEVIRASNFAAKEAYRQSGVVEELEWLTTDDEMTCEWCGPMNGEHIKLNETFFDKGDKFQGSDGSLLEVDYESVQHPPLHPNCRCTIIPIIK